MTPNCRWTFDIKKRFVSKQKNTGIIQIYTVNTHNKSVTEDGFERSSIETKNKTKSRGKNLAASLLSDEKL